MSNGPGDPKKCNHTIETAKKILERRNSNIGNMSWVTKSLALSAGADTYKLKYGHRGQNKSCVNQIDEMSFITSQNHGYGIEPV